jgi:hypothetical protein
MPILDRIEAMHTYKDGAETEDIQWALGKIDEIESNQKSIKTIMSSYFMQQIPVKLKNYADFNKIRADFNTDSDIQKHLTGFNNVKYTNFR